MRPALTGASLTALTLTGVTVGYLRGCLARPFTRCRRCHGTGRAAHRRRVRLCRHCHGHGLRVRPGRRLAGALLRLHHHATDPTGADLDRRWPR